MNSSGQNMYESEIVTSTQNKDSPPDLNQPTLGWDDDHIVVYFDNRFCTLDSL